MPVGIQHVERVVGDTFNQKSEIAFALEQIPLLLFVFSEHPTACLTGANVRRRRLVPQVSGFLTKRHVTASSATTLRNVAASVRNAASLAGSLTFECSITFDDAKPRQLLRRADIDQPRRRDPPGERRDRKAGQRRRGHRGDAAADKALAPGDAGLVERADGDARARRRAGPASRAAAPRRAARRSVWRRTSRTRLRSVSRRRGGCLPAAPPRRRARRHRRRPASRAKSRSSPQAPIATTSRAAVRAAAPVPVPRRDR